MTKQVERQVGQRRNGLKQNRQPLVDPVIPDQQKHEPLVRVAKFGPGFGA
jgi:hypothetical protein